MNNFDFKNITSVHFIGIGGIGMSAIAKILQNKGFNISGSDANESENIEYLRKLNIDIFIGHSAKNISNQDVVVYSSAVTNSNPEMIEAKNKNIPTIRRAEFLGKLIKLWPFRIGIAGTHGKTTTSSIASILFMEANLDPTFIIGGILQNVNTNALLGTGEYIIYEADEYDRTFLALPPTYSIITNIEMDHSDIYSDIEDMKETFTKFANSTSENGFTVLCGDDENIQKIMPNIRRKIISYGFDKKSDYKIEFIGTNEQTSKFKIYFRNELLDIFEINALGNHNILNASAVIALAHQLKISTAKIKNGILKYTGVQRRFEIKHKINDIIFVDDYAHHPSEIEATLKSTKKSYPNRRIIAMFQPHLYSRTQDFYREFAKALLVADEIFIAKIYPAREKPIDGITSQLIADIVEKSGHKKIRYIKDFTELENEIASIIRENDILISLGAGTINMSLEKIYEIYEQRIMQKK